jgi:hypothetical protein
MRNRHHFIFFPMNTFYFYFKLLNNYQLNKFINQEHFEGKLEETCLNYQLDTIHKINFKFSCEFLISHFIFDELLNNHLP